MKIRSDCTLDHAQVGDVDPLGAEPVHGTLYRHSVSGTPRRAKDLPLLDYGWNYVLDSLEKVIPDHVNCPVTNCFGEMPQVWFRTWQPVARKMTSSVMRS